MTAQHISEQACLEIVNRSPEMVAAHNKKGWCALFAKQSTIEDPVGSRPHESHIYHLAQGEHGPIGCFYDTFIAPNRISFYVQRDTICGLHVIRDLTMEIMMSATVIVRVPMHLHYELVREEGILKIARLRAYWELSTSLKQQMAFGLNGLPAMYQMGQRMLAHQKLEGVLGFLTALKTIGLRGKERLANTIYLFNQRDYVRFLGLFVSEHVSIDFVREKSSLTAEQWFNRGGELSVNKMIAAGRSVVANLLYKEGSSCHQGTLVIDFEWRRLKIMAIKCYW